MCTITFISQHDATSGDGTLVPYFIVHPRAMALDGSNPTILYAYGGFAISLTPTYSALTEKLWLERGGEYVVANIRGGGEFGPAWHEAGLATHRERIYDDFAAVARDLVTRKITRSNRLGIEGGPNGGLLVGVEFTQHPELFAAVDIQVPLLDMLRFEQIAAGSAKRGGTRSVARANRERHLMRALLCRGFGAPETTEYVEIDEPVAGPGEVLIDVHAAGVNFPDVLMVQGLYQVRPALPFVPGLEAAGTIVALGAGVREFALGQRVVAAVRGAFAERAIADARMTVPLPADIDTNLAAGMLITYGTAYHALIDRAALQAGERVFISGAGGGVGVAAVGVAKALGARVVGSAASEPKRAAARAAGADAVLDANDSDLARALKTATSGGLDVALDNVGGEQFEAALRAAAWRARLLIVGFAGATIPQIPANRVLLREVDVRGVYWGDWAQQNPDANRRNMERVFALVASGSIAARIETTYAFERARDALVDLGTRRIVGKAVVRLS